MLNKINIKTILFTLYNINKQIKKIECEYIIMLKNISFHFKVNTLSFHILYNITLGSKLPILLRKKTKRDVEICILLLINI